MNKAEQLAALEPEEDFTDMTVRQLHAELDSMRELQLDRNEKKAAFQKADELLKAKKERIRAIGEALGIRGRIKTQSGKNIYEIPGEPTWFATVQDFGAFSRWAKENAPGLIRDDTRVSAGMNSLIRRRKEDGRPLPPGLGALPRYSVKVFGLKDDEDE